MDSAGAPHAPAPRLRRRNRWRAGLREPRPGNRRVAPRDRGSRRRPPDRRIAADTRSISSSVSSGASQLGPRQFQRRSELREEMPHSGFAAGHSVDEKRAHERPAQPGAEPDRVVDLLRRRDAVVDQPQRLAPKRFEQSVGDEAVDLLASHAAAACRCWHRTRSPPALWPRSSSRRRRPRPAAADTRD